MGAGVQCGFCAGRWSLFVLATLALSACGGGGGSSGSSGSGAMSMYSIGGTVSGLSATGLVLTDNGGDSLSVPSGATAFTFSTALTSGATYDVAVAAQPTNETCAVSSGSGTVTGTVTSVTVTCTVNAFTISGTVSGLNAAQLKLQDYSGGEILSVSPGSTTFMFTNAVSYGTNVQVTVTQQPSYQVCTAGASNFSGPITANITAETFVCAVATNVSVTTLAGSTTAGSTDGTGSAASFSGPAGVAVDSSGNVYVADSKNNEIRKITPAGVVTTLAGSTTAGSANGTGSAASFDLPVGVAVDSAGNVYVADTFNNEIRKITPTGVVTTLAGSTTAGDADGTGSAASFNGPEGVAVDASGNVYVADTGNNEIRKITPTGVVTTLAGSLTAGSNDGTGTAASFNGPTGIAVDSVGNLYVADHNNNEIREITPSGVVTTLAGSTTAGNSDGTGSSASFSQPQSVAVDGVGNVYVADSGNNEIRLVAPTGVVTTLAGSATAGSTNGPAGTASFDNPSGVAVDASDNLYVGDFNNNEIREITP